MMRLITPGGVFLVLVPLEFEDCLGQLRNESNQVTNERFATTTQWIDFFGAENLVHYEVLGSGTSKDIALIYISKGENN